MSTYTLKATLVTLAVTLAAVMGTPTAAEAQSNDLDDVGAGVGDVLAVGGTALALSLGGGFAGGMVGAGLEDCSDGEFLCGLGGFVLGGTVGLNLGAAAGATLGGAIVDYNGSFAASLLGSAIGFGAGVALVAATDGDGVGAVFLVGMPTVGATVGYLMSGSPEGRRQRVEGSLINVDPVEGVALGFPAVSIQPTADKGLDVFVPLAGGAF